MVFITAEIGTNHLGDIKIVKQQRNEAEKAGEIEKSRELQNKLREMQLALTH